MAHKVVIVDSGGANIASVRFALERLGVEAPVTADADAIRQAARVILPGVGAAGDAMRQLQARALVPVLRSLTQPVLGICLGMQLLFSHSEEGDAALLDIIPGHVRRFRDAPGKTVPHMGWNSVNLTTAHPLTAGLTPDSYFYFVHSYHAPVGAATIGVCTYDEEFSAIVARGNFMGCQFHPERSGAAGHMIFKNFLECSL